MRGTLNSKHPMQTDHDETIKAQSLELESTLITKIKEAYAQSVSLAALAKDNASAAIEKALECGQYLIEAKQTVGHGKWTEWFSSRVTDFNQDTAARYMKLAKFVNDGGSLADATSQRQAMLAAGILIEKTREEGSQNSHGESCKWLSLISRAWAELDTIKAKLDQWPTAQRVTLKEKLRPYVELYQTL